MVLWLILNCHSQDINGCKFYFCGGGGDGAECETQSFLHAQAFIPCYYVQPQEKTFLKHI
jgi:hypothetical protein